MTKPVKVSNPAAKAQAIIFLAISSALIVFGIPSSISEATEGKMGGASNCVASKFGIFDIWRMIIIDKIGGCDLGNYKFHDTWILRNQIMVLAIILGLLAVFLSFKIAKHGPIGADKILPAIGYSLLGFGALAVVAFFIMVYAAFIAIVIMVSIVIGFVAFST